MNDAATETLPKIPSFFITHSNDIPLDQFQDPAECIKTAIAAAQKNISETRQTAEEKYGANSDDVEWDEAYSKAQTKVRFFRDANAQIFDQIQDYLNEIGFRKVRHLGNGTFGIAVDCTEDQIIRISINDEPLEREKEPEFLHPILTHIQKFDDKITWKIEVFPKVQQTMLKNPDGTNNAAVVQAVENLVCSQKKRGIWCMDIEGDNYGFLRDGTLIHFDPGSSVSRHNYDNMRQNANNDKRNRAIIAEIEEARNIPLTHDYFDSSLHPNEINGWHQKKLYPLIGTDTPAGIISDADLALMKTGEKEVSFLRADGRTTYPKFESPRQKQKFLDKVEEGLYPTQALKELGINPGVPFKDEAKWTDRANTPPSETMGRAS